MSGRVGGERRQRAFAFQMSLAWICREETPFFDYSPEEQKEMERLVNALTPRNMLVGGALFVGLCLVLGLPVVFGGITLVVRSERWSWPLRWAACDAFAAASMITLVSTAYHAAGALSGPLSEEERDALPAAAMRRLYRKAHGQLLTLGLWLLLAGPLLALPLTLQDDDGGMTWGAAAAFVVCYPLALVIGLALAASPAATGSRGAGAGDALARDGEACSAPAMEGPDAPPGGAGPRGASHEGDG